MNQQKRRIVMKSRKTDEDDPRVEITNMKMTVIGHHHTDPQTMSKKIIKTHVNNNIVIGLC